MECMNGIINTIKRIETNVKVRYLTVSILQILKGVKSEVVIFFHTDILTLYQYGAIFD